MRYMLDTNIVSYYLRRSSPALEERLNEGLKERSVAISAITRAELRYGQRGMAPDDRRRPLVDSFLQRLPSVEWSIEAADHYGPLKQTLALAEKLILVTHNTRHFERVPGLTLEDWVV